MKSNKEWTVRKIKDNLWHLQAGEELLMLTKDKVKECMCNGMAVKGYKLTSDNRLIKSTKPQAANIITFHGYTYNTHEGKALRKHTCVRIVLDTHYRTLCAVCLNEQYIPDGTAYMTLLRMFEEANITATLVDKVHQGERLVSRPYIELLLPPGTISIPSQGGEPYLTILPCGTKVSIRS